MADESTHTEFLWNVHSYTNEYIRFADAKAGAVFAWCGGLIGLLFASKAHHYFTKSQLASCATVDWGTTALAIAALAAFIFLIGGAVLSFVVVKPRLWSKEGTIRHVPGLIYWETIRAHATAATYAAELLKEDPAKLCEHGAKHLFVIAGIAQKKFEYVDFSIWLAFIGSALAVVVTLFTE